jgi:hypothetical protein
MEAVKWVASVVAGTSVMGECAGLWVNVAIEISAEEGSLLWKGIGPLHEVYIFEI